MPDADPPDVQLILTSISGRAVCAPCIAAKIKKATADVDVLFVSVRRTVQLLEDIGTCQTCGKQTVVYRLGSGHHAPSPT